MSEQINFTRDENRYDVWKCAKCGGIRVVRAIPHSPPSCCGTGMWYQEGRVGQTYTVAVAPTDA